MAGNGTIGLELLEQSTDFDAVVVPWGGGGLFTGIASAVKAERPGVRDVGRRAGDRRAGDREPRGGRAGRGRVHAVVRRRLRRRELIPRVWEQAAGCSTARSRCRSPRWPPRCVWSPSATRVIAEGAGALSVAAALSGRVPAEEDRLRRLRREHRPCCARTHPGGRDAVNIEAVRERFTSLQKGFAYFDAPGGTQVPDEVGDAVANAMREASSNYGFRTRRAARPPRSWSVRARRRPVPRLHRRTRSRSA